MRTDSLGREIAPDKKKLSMFRGSRLFAFGLAVGAGICVGMGPPLPLLDKALARAAAHVPVVPAQSSLPRQWLVLRDAVLDPNVTGVTYSQQQADIQLLRGKWLAVSDAVESALSNAIATR